MISHVVQCATVQRMLVATDKLLCDGVADMRKQTVPTDV